MLQPSQQVGLVNLIGLCQEQYEGLLLPGHTSAEEPLLVFVRPDPGNLSLDKSPNNRGGFFGREGVEESHQLGHQPFAGLEDVRRIHAIRVNLCARSRAPRSGEAHVVVVVVVEDAGRVGVSACGDQEVGWRCGSVVASTRELALRAERCVLDLAVDH